MKTAKIWSVVLTAALFLIPAAPSQAARAVPKDVKYLLGMYYGNGSVFLVRENKDRLEVVYRSSEEDKDFSEANIFPLKKMHFDSYTITEEGPLLGAEASVKFERDNEGNGILVKIGGKRFSRDFFPGQGGKALRIEENASYESLKTAAASAGMPPALQKGEALPLVNLQQTVPATRLDLRYATANNIFGKPLYDDGTRAYIASPAGEALKKVAAELAVHGYGLVIWEAYRPWSISKLASDLLPAKQKGMLPLPDKGEDRNTGLAVDVSLYTLADGLPVDMISDFDEVSVRQMPEYPGGTQIQREQRDLLAAVMKKAGFIQGKEEWWHFTLGDPVGKQHLNIPYSQLR